MRSADPTYPLFPIFAFLGFVLSLIPLPWHFQAWNSGTCAFMIWTASLCLVEFVNSIIWSGNVNNIAPVWCDISTQIILGGGIGIPASTLCITRRLYNITSVRTVSVSRDDKKRAVIVDLFIAVGLPILILIMHVVVQPHRFDILEDIGCYPVTYNTLPAYFLYYMWPIVIGVISFVYSGLTLRNFWMRRAQFSQLMSSSHALSTSRYFRLMLLALVDMMCTIPLGAYVIYVTSGGSDQNLAPWISWEDTHFDFGHVDLIPTLLWRSSREHEVAVEVTRWLSVFSAFVFFSLFGFAAEARKHYSLAFWRVARIFGCKPRISPSAKVSLPSWIDAPKSPISSSSPPPAYTSQQRDKILMDRDVKGREPVLTSVQTIDHCQYDEDIEAQFASSSTSDHFSFRPSKSWVSFTTLDFAEQESHCKESITDRSQRLSVSSSTLPHAI